MNDLINRENGANYHLCDLHVHTPGDEGYSIPEDIDINTEDGKEEFSNQFVQSSLDKGISVIGITDHNSVEWVDRIREAARGTKLTVFPGFEISAKSGKEGIHLVCLFDPDASKDELDDIITQLGLPRDDRQREDGDYKVCERDLSSTISLVIENGGLPVAAHMDSDSGILNSMKGELRVRAWTDPNLLAGELPKARSEYDLGTFAGKVVQNEADVYERDRPIAIIHSSDSRSLSDIGSRSTYIKLSSLSIEGLKQAFLDWGSRIRHPDYLPEEEFSKLIAARWTGGFLDGLSIRFNENLNCLIGGKGTGKSTVLETLRYAFDKEPEHEEIRKDHKSIVDEVFKAGSEIEVLVEKHEPDLSRYLIRRAHNEEPVVYRWDDEANDRGEPLRDLSPDDILPGLEIYGQKEILELSRDSSIQINLLKWFVGKEVQDKFEREEKSVQKRLRRNADNIIKTREDISDLEGKQETLSKLRERKRQYDEIGLKEQLKIKRYTIKEESLFDRSVDELSELETAIDEFANSDANLTFLDGEEIEDLPHNEILEQLKDNFSDLDETVGSSIEKIREEISSTEAEITDLKDEWKAEKAEIEEDIQEKLRELDKNDIDVDDYLKIERRIADLEPEVEKRETLEEDVEELQGEREELLDQLEDNRRSYFQELDDAASVINDELEGIIHVEITYRGNRSDYQEELSELKSGARKNQLENLVDHPDFTPRRFGRAARNGVDDMSEQFDIRESTARNLVEECSDEDLFRLESIRVPPSITIEFNVGTGGDHQYKPTQELSVGQRCTAILLLILLHNPYPLLVDQPEDDLDNSFVYSEVVERLRFEKERRQFVISTHDANIPVLGDAELIQVLEARSGSLVVDECIHGSIDNTSMRTPVETILEGGREAFMRRKEKYGF